MKFKKFRDSLLSLKEIMEKIWNIKDECELKTKNTGTSKNRKKTILKI